MVFFIAVTVLLLPGLAWLVLFRDRDQDLLEQLAEVIGVSIALTAIIALGLFLADWKLSTAGLVGIYAALVVVIVGSLAYRKLFPNQSVHSDSLISGQQPGQSSILPPRTSAYHHPGSIMPCLWESCA